MMQIHKAKSPKKIHFRYEWGERIFFRKTRKQQTNILFEQESSRRNINSDPSATNIQYVDIKYHVSVVLHHVDRLRPTISLYNWSRTLER